MRAVVLDAFGGADVLHVAALAKPQIGAEDVLVRVSYAAVNPIDAKTRGGKGVPVDHFPAVLGWDVCGVIVQRGANVAAFKEGDEVFGMVQFPAIASCYADYVRVPASSLARRPENVTMAEAGGASMASLAAWQALFPFCGPLAGLRVLIHGGAGGVGHVAVQLARLAGAEVTATASADNRAFLTELGANRVVDYNHERIEDAVRDLDVVIDTRGGADYARLVKTLKSSGIIVSLLGREQAQNAPEALSRRIRTGFVYVQPDGTVLQRVAQLMADRSLKIIIDKQFAVDQAAKAHRYVEAGHSRGRVLLRMAE
jgi:NADPH:quinone reductase-like Zn-dependent oxidoreductase